jgi:N-acetylneuraminic acid mutarotase
VHVYLDLATDKWVTAADLPDQLDHVGTTSVGGMLYAMGGYNPKGVTDEAFRWDPATNTWTTLPSMPAPRAAAVAVVLDGKIHLIGGRGLDPHFDLTRHDVYDPATGAWSTAAPIPRATDHAAYAVVGGKIHVVGGRPGENTEHDVYDPATDKWSTAAPLLAPRNSFAGAAFGGRFLVMGGENSTETKVFGEVWAWDPATDAWSTLPKLPQPVQGIGAAVVAGRLYVPAGGPAAGASLETDRLQILEPAADGPGKQGASAPGY